MFAGWKETNTFVGYVVSVVVVGCVVLLWALLRRSIRMYSMRSMEVARVIILCLLYVVHPTLSRVYVLADMNVPVNSTGYSSVDVLVSCIVAVFVVGFPVFIYRVLYSYRNNP